MTKTWDKTKGNYGQKIHRGQGFSIFYFPFSVFVAGLVVGMIAVICLMPCKALSMPLEAAAELTGVGSVCGEGAGQNIELITQTPFLSVDAMSSPTAYPVIACAGSDAQANLTDSFQLSVDSFKYKPTADSELAGQLNACKLPTDNLLAKDGCKEVRPAALRGGNHRPSRSRSANNGKLEIVDCRLKSEYETILNAARRNGLNAEQTAILFAIRKAENGRTGREFGVLHPKAVDTDLATQAGWAAATIKKNALRFSKQVGSRKSGVRGKEFIHYLADRYCPPSVDPEGNRNWKKNVMKIVDCQL